jgi:uncharacterized membrane protein YpjA
LLSKPAAAIFPLVLFCIDLLRTRKLSAKLFVEKIPFFALAYIAGIITYVAQKEKGALNAYAFGADTRLLMGFYGIMMYFIKMIVPSGFHRSIPTPRSMSLCQTNIIWPPCFLSPWL